MSNVVSIVEGHGEVAALPVLLRRLSAWKTPHVGLNVMTPIRVKRDRFLNRDEEFARYLQFAATKCGNEGWVLILLDADDDCPAQLGTDILRRARVCLPGLSLSVVLANREYEGWFIAAAQSLHGERGFTFQVEGSVNAEQVRDAKGWIKARMTGNVYSETNDQPAFSARMSLEQAYDGSRSFRKLCGEWLKQVR